MKQNIYKDHPLWKTSFSKISLEEISVLKSFITEEDDHMNPRGIPLSAMLLSRTTNLETDLNAVMELVKRIGVDQE
jgi:hypothetical protein